jgi:protein SCO1/2
MKQKIIIAVAIVFAIVAGAYVSLVVAPSLSSKEPEFVRLYPQPRELAEVALTDQNGKDFTKQQLEGKWTLAFVGYTYCPDVCPTTLAELKSIYPDLKAIKTDNPLQILFLSVDPNRDKTERLKEYIDFFNPEFIAASAKHKILFPLVRSMGMLYSLSDPADDPDYLVSHSASVVVINPQAQVIGRFQPTAEPGQVAISDGQQILADMPVLVN